MQIAPVNYRQVGVPLDHLVVVRAAGADRVDRLFVSRDFDVRVVHHDGRRSRFQLDASEAEDLVHALGSLVAGDVHTADPAAVWRFDIELGWRGQHVRLHNVDVPEDDAAHGVVQFARQAFDREFDRVNARRGARQRVS